MRSPIVIHPWECPACDGKGIVEIYSVVDWSSEPGPGAGVGPDEMEFIGDTCSHSLDDFFVSDYLSLIESIGDLRGDVEDYSALMRGDI